MKERGVPGGENRFDQRSLKIKRGGQKQTRSFAIRGGGLGGGEKSAYTYGSVLRTEKNFLHKNTEKG